MEERVIEEGGLIILYANVRGLRQAAAQLRMRAELISPTFIILTENFFVTCDFRWQRRALLLEE